MVVRKCIASWRRHLGDYRMVEWNETNFDMKSNRYLREAYESKKWAFVSDYIRMRVIHDQGGVYLDSDCYVFGGLNAFLRHSFFSGFEVDAFPFTAVFGAEAGHPLVSRVLQDYDARSFFYPMEGWILRQTRRS